MSTDPQAAPRPLPERPNLRHLKDQAKDLKAAGGAKSLADAQFLVARSYGFASWPKLKAHVESLEETGKLRLAIDANDLAGVKRLMSRNPALHTAPLGYRQNGPLTWVAECRIPWEPPSPTRLVMAAWMIEHGSNVHKGGDGPLMRAALRDDRLPMMELLVGRGADVNAWWDGRFPILFAACEALAPKALAWLLDHGADPNVAAPLSPPGGPGGRGTALDYAIGTYARAPDRLTACIEALLVAGGATKYDVPGMLDLLRQRTDLLAARLDADPALVHRRFPELDCGSTGGRRLLLQRATLLHVAAEFGVLGAAALLLDRGADVNARADRDPDGVGGQTALFHAVTQFGDAGLPMARLLVERGADVNVRAKLPGHYERGDEVVDCTPLGYALHLRDEALSEGATIAFLRERGAKE